MQQTRSGNESTIYSRTLSEKRHRLEIRVQEDSGALRLGVEADMNEVRIPYRLCAVFYLYGLNILQARIRSPEGQGIQDEFLVQLPEGSLPVPAIRSMIDDLESMLFGGLSVLEYLSRHQAAVPRTLPGDREGAVFIEEVEGQLALVVSGRDRPGLLLALAQAFYLMDIDIVQAEIQTETAGGAVRNQFVVDPEDNRFESQEFQRRLLEELRSLVGHEPHSDVV